MAKIDEPSADLLNQRSASQAVSTLIGGIIVSLMMMTLAAGVVQFGARLFPEWQGRYLVWVSLVVSLEAMYSRKQAVQMEGRDKILFRASEWVAISVAIKILLYLVHGPAQLLEDLSGWQENFIENFFTPEYVLVLFLSLGVWLASSTYVGEMEELFEREKDAEWDEIGKLQNALKEIRGRISAKVFVIGTIVVILAVGSRIDASAIFRAQGVVPPGYQSPVANVLIYFILALVLLSLTQFTLLRSRWLSQRVPVSPALAGNWLKSGLMFFIILAVIVFFLPTDYTLGLLDTLRYLLDLLVKAATFLVFLITFPLTLCLSLFRLSESNQGKSPPPPTFSPPPPVEPGQPAAWLEAARSLAFWAIFLGIIIFAVRYYLIRNTALLSAIRKFPVINWLAGFFSSAWGWLKGANRQIGTIVREGIKRLRPKAVRLPGQAIRRLFNPTRLSPREKILFYYLSLIQISSERGLSRQPSQTPYQYESKLKSEVPEIDQDLHELTDRFVEARYSLHTVEEDSASQTASLWDRIKAVLRQWRNRDD